MLILVLSCQFLPQEQFVKLGELDVSYWAYWLSAAGYTDAVGVTVAAACLSLCMVDAGLSDTAHLASVARLHSCIHS